jgi:ABC-type uncharacterized transport system substrate-binding protein
MTRVAPEADHTLGLYFDPLLSSIADAVKRLALGLVLISAAAAALLFSDLGSRNRTPRGALSASSRVFNVALVQHASQAIIEDGVRGIREGLKERGYEDGGRLKLRLYNAEGDLPTASAIAREVTAGGNDLVITVTTPSLQTVANANKLAGKTPHVFGLVTDPYGSGVGIDRERHLDHPPYLTGYGTLQPVERAFELAREMRPELQRVGLVWNATEVNSAIQTKIARAACARLGLTLVEVNAESSSAVGEAAGSLVARGVDAVFISGDVTVLVAAEAVIGAARRVKVPVFTVIPPTAEKGALFDLGADYPEIGRAVGRLAADVLGGKSPAEIPVENFVPERLVINTLALDGLKDHWQIPEAVAARAQTVIDAGGKHVRPAAASTHAPAPTRIARVDLIEYLDTPNVEMTREGIMAGFAQAGFTVGRDLDVRRHNAQGDMTALGSIIDAAVTDRSDLLLTASTPALQGALRRGKGLPIVFSLVADPMVAGAGQTSTDHLPYVTGAYIPAAHEEGLAALKQCVPTVRRIGTLFTPAEVNSVYYKEQMEAAAKAAGLELVVVGVSSSSEVADAALALCARNLDAVAQISDNMTGASFASIAEAAKRHHLPLLAFASGQAKKGAFLTVSRDFHDGGVASALMAARVLRGESPAGIPFQLVTKLRYVVNVNAATALGITIPPALLARADETIR